MSTHLRRILACTALASLSYAAQGAQAVPTPQTIDQYAPTDVTHAAYPEAIVSLPNKTWLVAGLLDNATLMFRVSHDDGATWAPVTLGGAPIPTGAIFTSMSASADGQVWMLLQAQNSAGIYEAVVVPATLSGTSVQAQAPILYTGAAATGAGAGSVRTFGSQVQFNGLEKTPSGLLQGYVRQSLDSGKTWQTLELTANTTSTSFSDSTVAPGGNYYAAGFAEVKYAGPNPITRGVIMHSADGGKTWKEEFTRIAPQGSSVVEHIATLDDGSVLACGESEEHWLTRPIPFLAIKRPTDNQWKTQFLEAFATQPHINCDSIAAHGGLIGITFNANTGHSGQPMLITSNDGGETWNFTQQGQGEADVNELVSYASAFDSAGKLRVASADYVYFTSAQTYQAQWLLQSWDLGPSQNPKLENWTLPPATPVAAYFEALPALPPDPPTNPTTPAKVELGHLLFYDARLSSDGTVSCNSCHNLNTYGVDGKPVSNGIGGKPGTRNSPTVINSGYQAALFWDGRAATLEDQAQQPLLNPIEMGMPNGAAVEKVIQSIPEYRPYFVSAFGANPEPITFQNIVKAMASFERTLNAVNSPFDRYMGGQTNALSAAAIRGMSTVNRIGCLNCHSGPNFNGRRYAGEGIPYVHNFPLDAAAPLPDPTDPAKTYANKYHLMDDLGIFLLNNNPGSMHAFRVCSWRNAEKTAPYFMNGSVSTLAEAIKVMAATQLDYTFQGTEAADVEAFIDSLTGDFTPPPVPALPGIPAPTAH